MKMMIKTAALTLALLSLWLIDFTPERPLVPVLVPDAKAVIGRPVTPVSYAGVARRTTRRAVYATSASASAQQQQQQQQQQEQQQQQQSQQAPAGPAKGSVVTALPDGCQSITVDGGSFFSCGSTVYKPTFQGSNLVYVVQ